MKKIRKNPLLWLPGACLLLLLSACSNPNTTQKDGAKNDVEIIFLPGIERTPSETPNTDSGPQDTNPTIDTTPSPDTPTEQPQPDRQPPPDNTPEVILPDHGTPEPTPEPPPRTSWIGEPCRQDADCKYNGGLCLKESAGFPEGHCSMSCTSTCPDQAGKPVTFCIQGTSGKGQCVSQCEQSACRTNYVCETRARLNDPSKNKKVCVPKPKPPTPGSQRRVLLIGDSLSSGSKFGYAMVDFMRNPQKTCPGAKTANNIVYSYAKVSAAARHWSQQTGTSKTWLCGATKVYTNGTGPADTNGAQLCSGITNTSQSIFEKLVALHKPNTFVIQLGSNSSGFAESYVKSKIRAMLDQMPTNSLCFWVPPSFCASKYLAKHRDLERWTKETLASYTRIPCQTITSIDEIAKQTTCTSFNAGDGLHHTSCGSQLWATITSQKICKLGKL